MATAFDGEVDVEIPVQSPDYGGNLGYRSRPHDTGESGIAHAFGLGLLDFRFVI